jgi:16S rRNA (guanine(966)-N(2))-methyltransferase RsmD
MRVITGLAKGHRLKAPAGLGTRPMLDKVKESLFAVLDGYGAIQGCVLDLFAGTGSLGIECLSRGAKTAHFVEQNQHVCHIIKQNLVHTRFVAQSHVFTMPVMRFLQRTGPTVYDLIILDPPYADPVADILRAVIDTAHITSEGLIVVGHSPRVELADRYDKYERLKFRKLGDSCFSIYEQSAL